MTLFPGPSLDELRNNAAKCTACDLYKDATQTVFGEGPPDARLVLIGEVPGDKEDLAGHPFVGPAGKVLDDALAAAGIDRARRVPDQRGEALQVRAARQGAHPQEAERGRGRGVQAVVGGRARRCASRRCSACSARSPAKRCSARSSASRSNAGRWLDGPDGVPTLATIHPSAVLRAPAERRDQEYAGLVRDLKLIAARVPNG